MVYAEYVQSETEGAQAQVNPMANADTAVATKIDNFIEPKPSDPGEASSNDSFEWLNKEFIVTEKTAPAIDPNFAEIVKSLFSEKTSQPRCRTSSLGQKTAPTWLHLR